MGGEKGEEDTVDSHPRLPLQVDAARGVVYGGREHQSQWQHRTSAPITAMWVQDGYRLNRVNLSSHSIYPEKLDHPALMMGRPACMQHTVGKEEVCPLLACSAFESLLEYFRGKCMYIPGSL